MILNLLVHGGIWDLGAESVTASTDGTLDVNPVEIRPKSGESLVLVEAFPTEAMFAGL